MLRGNFEEILAKFSNMQISYSSEFETQRDEIEKYKEKTEKIKQKYCEKEEEMAENIEKLRERLNLVIVESKEKDELLQKIMVEKNFLEEKMEQLKEKNKFAMKNEITDKIEKLRLKFEQV